MDRLGDRMKEYEFHSRHTLPKRVPLMIRIDGKSFHTYTREMNKPFDERLQRALWETSAFLASQIIGCRLAYQQSDEISLLLINYEQPDSEAWFNNQLQKIVSVSASMATAKFNALMREHRPELPLAFFDARAWILPKEEVANYFIWRQQDATKNSISMVARAHFSHKEVDGLKSNQLQDKLMLEKNLNWNDLPVWQKRGVCVVKKTVSHEVIHQGQLVRVQRNQWMVDENIPIFTQDRAYIEQYVYPNRDDPKRET